MTWSIGHGGFMPFLRVFLRVEFKIPWPSITVKNICDINNSTNLISLCCHMYNYLYMKGVEAKYGIIIRTHGITVIGVTVIGVGSLSFKGNNHLEVAGSILTAGV